MSVYKIKFVNNSSGPGPSDFTVYSAPPAVTGFPGLVQTWSNSLLTRSVPQGGTWSFAINDAPLAYCGTASKMPLGPDANIDVTMFRHATLGGHGPGSRHTMYNVDGFPAFRDDNYTAPIGAYEIETGSDFTPNLKWVAGYGVSDGSGQPKPAATFVVENSKQYVVLPPSAPRLYLGAFKSTSGSLIDPDMFVKLVEIDFAQAPGQHNAIVTLDDNGIYIVEFMTQPVFAMRAADPVSVSQDPSVQLTQLKHQVKIMSDLIDTALGISGLPAAFEYLWNCSYEWNADIIIDSTKIFIANALSSWMEDRGYVLRGAPVRFPNLLMAFAHPTKSDRLAVYYDWTRARQSLPSNLQNLLKYPNVEQVFVGNSTSSVDDVTTPVLRPNYECIIDWLEGPNDETKQIIFEILKNGMEKQEYYTFEPRIDETSLVLPVWHLDRPSVETVLVAWRKAIDRLGPVMLKNYVTNPRVEGLVYHDDTNGTVTEQTVNGQDTATIFPPLDPAYACYLTWLEGAPLDTRLFIMSKLRRAMVNRGYQFMGASYAGEKLEIRVSHSRPWTLEQTKNDWNAAYNSLEFERMFVTAPYVESLKRPAAATAVTNAATTLIFPPLDPTYIFSLTWLEGPTPLVKASIASKLLQAMLMKGYQHVGGPDLGGDELRLILSHAKPSDLKTATADWIAAVGNLGFQMMYVTAPKCEEAPVIQSAADVSTSLWPVMPPKYVCSLDWLEGPNPETKLSIINNLVRFMAARKYYFMSGDVNEEKLSIYFSHDFPYDLPTATADWNAAYHSLGFQQMYVTNPQCEFAYTIQAGNISPSDIKLDEIATEANGTNGSVNQGDQPTDISAIPQVPALEARPMDSLQSETIEEKKRRALELLRREGLIGISGLSIAA